MSSPRTERRRQRRFDAAHAGRRNRNRAHRHQVAFPHDHPAVDLPPTFSNGAYERQSSWFRERTGVGSFMGGPLNRWCYCPIADPRPAAARAGRPYWQPVISEEQVAAWRDAESRRLSDFAARVRARRAAGEPAFGDDLFSDEDLERLERAAA